MVHRAPWPRAALVVVIAAWTIAACDPFAQSSTSAATQGPAASAAASEAAPEPTGATATVPAAPEGPTQEALVVRVADGDTIEVEIDGQAETVRYLGMDAPELADAAAGSGGQDEPLARQAMAANRGLVGDKTVLLELDVTEADDEGRLLRYVWVDVNGTLRLVNHILLARGFAELQIESPDIRYADALEVAEASARDRAAGIWATDAGAPTPTPEATPAPEPTPTPEPIIEEEETVIGEGQSAFRGEAGTYRWTAITFTSTFPFAIRWSATSTSGACEMEWSLTGANTASGRSSLTDAGQANGRAALPAPDAGRSELTVTSDCRKWLITFNEVPPPPTPEPTPEPTPGPSADPSAGPITEASPSPST